MKIPAPLYDVLLASASEALVATTGSIVTQALEDPTMRVVAISMATQTGMFVAVGFGLRHVLRKRDQQQLQQQKQQGPVSGANLSPSLGVSEIEQTVHEWLHVMQYRLWDLLLKTGPAVPSYQGPVQLASERDPRPHPGLVRYEAVICKLLEDMVELFKLVAPEGTNITTSLRDLRSDRGYYTFARAGKHDPARSLNSQPLFEGRSVILKRLREHHAEKSSVIITGSNRGPEWWEKQKNDLLGNDLCVLMAAIMTRPRDGATGFIDNQHAWILCVSADREGVFTETHVPLMKNCVMLFSTVANALAREGTGNCGRNRGRAA